MSEATESNSPLEDGYSYESVDVIPLLCDSCQEPLTLSSTMKSLVMATNSLDFPIEVSGQDLCHACQGQRQFDPSR
jgi:hypothetical protein